jgi:hypothetical protein
LVLKLNNLLDIKLKKGLKNTDMKMKRLILVPLMAVCLFGMTSCGKTEVETVSKIISYLKTQSNNSLKVDSITTVTYEVESTNKEELIRMKEEKKLFSSKLTVSAGWWLDGGESGYIMYFVGTDATATHFKDPVSQYRKTGSVTGSGDDAEYGHADAGDCQRMTDLLVSCDEAIKKACGISLRD